MKIHVRSASLLSEAAKSLRAALGGRGVKLSLSQSQEALARLLGHDSYHALRKDPHSADPLDHELTEEERDRRHASEADLLSTHLGLSGSVALEVIREVVPSGIRRKPDEASLIRLTPELETRLVSLVEGRAVDDDHRGTTLDGFFRRWLREILCSKREHGLRDGMTVDEYLSNVGPHIEETYIDLGPVGFSGDGREIKKVWQRSGKDRSGWAALHDIFLGKGRSAAWYLREDARGDKDVLATDLADAMGCKRTELESRVKQLPVFQKVAEDLVRRVRARWGSEPLVDLVVKKLNKHGFYGWHPGIEEGRYGEGEYWRPLYRSQKQGDFKRFTVRAGEAEVMIETTRERSGYDSDDGGSPVSFHFFVAKAELAGRVIGVVRGELLKARDPEVSNHLFYRVAEELSGDLTHLAHIILTQHMDAVDLFGPGDLLYLSHWEVAEDRKGTGFAEQLLRAVVDELRRRHRALASIAYELHPVQYPHPFRRSLPKPIVRGYDEARARMKRHLASIGFDRVVSPFGHAIRFEVTPQEDGKTDNDRLRHHLKKAHFGIG